MISIFYRIYDSIISIPQYIKRAFIVIIRLLEFSLTGQTEYTIYKGEIAEFDVVVDKLKIKVLQDQVRDFMLRKFGIRLKRPVLVDLYSGSALTWKGIVMELSGNLGTYHSDHLGRLGIVHVIHIRKGLSKKRFMSILAHEMAHAFLREEKLINRDRYLREGFCRWVEYQYLKELGEWHKAGKLPQIKSVKNGREINKFLKLEEKAGVNGVMEVVRSMDKL